MFILADGATVSDTATYSEETMLPTGSSHDQTDLLDRRVRLRQIQTQGSPHESQSGHCFGTHLCLRTCRLRQEACRHRTSRRGTVLRDIAGKTLAKSYGYTTANEGRMFGPMHAVMEDAAKRGRPPALRWPRAPEFQLTQQLPVNTCPVSYSPNASLGRLTLS